MKREEVNVCRDNRFELIEKYKQQLIESTNIESSKEEMDVIDNILFRFWQVGWLDKLEQNPRFLMKADGTMEQIIEPCEDAISRKNLIAKIEDIYSGYMLDESGCCPQDFVDIAEDLPSVTPARPKGKWIYDDECKEHAHCSKCGYGSVDLVGGEPHNFCQKCGADMREV